jgi:4'-phosphopantetheinyl transferase
MIASLQLQRDGEPLDGFIGFSFAPQYQDLAGTLRTFLHPHEERYLAEAKSAERRSSYLLGRHAAKQALVGCLHEDDWRQIEIAWGVFGQPLVRYRTTMPPEISIAHTRGAAVAVACQAGHPIGVDLEYSAPPRAVSAGDVCVPSERALVLQTRLTHPSDLLLLWTIKEALAKVLRCGLMSPLAILQIEALEASDADIYVALFKNFAQYKAVAWVLESHTLAIVLPRRTDVGFHPDAELRRQLQVDRNSASGS